jgi:hypothetical protein
MNLVICMTCRNVGVHLPYIFANLERLIGYTLHFIFVYDNCIDNTETLLNEFKAKHDNVHISHLKNNNSKMRTVRIANARNECLRILKEVDTDFHIFLDPDDRNINKWNINVIDEYIKFRNDWDCISFNVNPYYDTWALQTKEFMWHSWGWGDHSSNVNEILRKHTENKLSDTNDDIEVISAFCGFAIYRTKKFNGLKYIGNINEFPKKFFKKEEINKSISFINKFIPAKINKDLMSDKNYFRGWEVILPGEICEHIYYHTQAHRNGNKIKISKKELV